MRARGLGGASAPPAPAPPNLDPTSLTFITKEFHEQNKRSKLQAGDILTIQTGFIGVSCLVPEEFVGANAHALIISRMNPKVADPVFICNFINSHQGQKGVWQIQTAGGRPHLNTGDFEEYYVPLPPLPEQRRIAGVLGAWDRALAGLEKLRAAHQQRKQALMQQLLTGQKRFPAFKGQKWRELVLTDVADVRFSSVDKHSHNGETPVRLCNYTDVYYNDTATKDMDFMSATATKREIAEFSLKRGDVLLTKDSEEADDIAKCCHVSEDMPGVLCGYHLAMLRPKKDKIEGEYLNRFLNLWSVRLAFSRHANGVTRYGLPVSCFGHIHVKVPGLDEQRKVIGVFRAVDRQLALLDREAAALRDQKKGLMQQLLTGKVRVKGCK